MQRRCTKSQFSAWDKQWLMTSIEGDRFEISGGTLAQNRGQNEKVRSLGARLVTDHSKSLRDATQLARRLGIDVPGEPSPSMQWELRTVAKFSGSQFDQAYADLEIADHQQDIQEAQDAVSDGCNPDVRRTARGEIPTLRLHLRLAKDAQAAVGRW